MDRTEKVQSESRNISAFARKGRWTAFWKIAAALGMNLIFLSAYALFISLVIVTKMDDSFTAAAIAVSIIGELLWLCGVILKNGRAYGKLIREIYKMPDEDFASMCVQVKETKPHFKTVYVLDRYLYVPSELFLLPLESVRRVESEIRSNSLRIFYAYLIIFHGRKRTRIKIKRKGEFRNNHVMFVRDLCDKCSDIKGENMIREKAGKINDKYD